MRKMLKAWLFTMLLLLPCMLASAGSLYPDTLDNGNYVCVDGGMGVGTYADRSSVVVQNYNPPNYQIAINIIRVQFSDDYWSKHETYVGGPYKVIGNFTAYFRYNWDRKSVACLRQNGWMDWNIHHDYEPPFCERHRCEMKRALSPGSFYLLYLDCRAGTLQNPKG